jgi:hypothetical protein
VLQVFPALLPKRDSRASAVWYAPWGWTDHVIS